MTSPTLVAIKATHSAIFLVMVGAIGWLIVTGRRGRRDRSAAVAAALVTTEIAVFVANDRTCPLTPLAERHGAVRGSVSDIWLPDVLARTLPAWSGALVALGAALHVRSWLRARGERRIAAGVRTTGAPRAPGRCAGSP